MTETKRAKKKNYEVQDGKVTIKLLVEVPEVIFNLHLDGKNPTRTAAANALADKLMAGIYNEFGHMAADEELAKFKRAKAEAAEPYNIVKATNQKVVDTIEPHGVV